MKTSKKILESNDILIKQYIKEYSVHKTPIEISFKGLYSDLTSDRYTHLIHTYPAKLLMHIPYLFLNNTVFSKKGQVVMDPFCGTGTVLLEALLAERKAIGADANPLARKITKVKTTLIEKKILLKYLHTITQRANRFKDAKIPDVVNIDHWFSESTQYQLARLLKAINGIKDENLKDFFLICFSNCIKKVSYADPRIAVPVKLNPLRFPKKSEEHSKIKQRIKELKTIDVYEKFKGICLINIDRLERLNSINKAHANVISTDARNLTESIGSDKKLKANSVQLIITSPPYAGAQKYIRSSSLNLGWTKLASTKQLLELDKKNIGRENFRANELVLKPTGIKIADLLIDEIYFVNKTRAKIVNEYILEMKEAINESIRVLKKDGYFVLIVGNNKVCNREFNTQEYLTEFLQKKGLKLMFKLIDDIKSYGLMTKRNKTADIISREWVLVFKK